MPPQFGIGQSPNKQHLLGCREQLRRTEGKKEFVFYDGPPFATGLPHYGHILAGSIKASRCITSTNQPHC